MKISFQSDINDMIEVALRSTGPNSRFYLDVAAATIGAGGLLGLAGYLLSGSWIGSIVGFTIGAIYTVASNYNVRERRIRKIIKDRQLISGPALKIDVEISDAGLSFKQMGTTTIHEWNTIIAIEETDDAIYFKTVSNFYCAVRKRAFASSAEKDEFLNLVRGFMTRASVPPPPIFR